MEFKDSILHRHLEQLRKQYNVPDIGLYSALLEECKLYYNRYETVRKLNTPQFASIVRRNLKGEKFDDIVDKYQP